MIMKLLANKFLKFGGLLKCEALGDCMSGPCEIFTPERLRVAHTC